MSVRSEDELNLVRSALPRRPTRNAERKEGKERDTMRSCELSIAALRRAYRSGSKTPRSVLTELLDACAAAPDGIWISLIGRGQLEGWIARLEASSPEELPLYGIPFAVKDNIDVAGLGVRITVIGRNVPHGWWNS